MASTSRSLSNLLSRVGYISKGLTKPQLLRDLIKSASPSFGAPYSISFAAAAGGANVSEVTITVKDANGDTLAGVYNLDVWLSDAATGAGLTGTSASGTVTAKAASGAVVGTYEAKKALRVQTLATGVFILEITDTAKTAFYVCAALPTSGEAQIATVLATADYGA